MRLKKRILIAGVFLIFLYVGSYTAFYLRGIPAGNLAYWVYLRGGGEKIQSEEWALYYFYYPIYKIHRVFGAGRHNYDRGINYNATYDGDEPKK
jgi:hypothetical protein